MRLKQVHFRGKQIEKKRKLLLLHVQPIRLLSLECSGGPKHVLLREGKTVILFPRIQFYKMVWNILSISEAFHLSIGKKILEEICIESPKKTKNVFGSSRDTENWKDITPKELCIYVDFHSSEVKSCKRLHSDEIWTTLHYPFLQHQCERRGANQSFAS